MNKIERAFGVMWVSCGENGVGPYSRERDGGFALRNDVEELQEKAARLWATVDLMRRAGDIETVRAIAEVAIGAP